MRHCGRCKTDKAITEFYKHRNGLQHWCRDCMSTYQQARWRADPERWRDRFRGYRKDAWERAPKTEWIVMAHHAAKRRAKAQDIPFTITYADIAMVTEDICPILGLPLDFVRTSGKIHATSPTMDRRINMLGYVPNNILVVSMRANRLKSDATVEELEALAKFYRNC